MRQNPTTKAVTLAVPDAEPAVRESVTPVQTSTLNTLFFARAKESERDALPERCQMCETLSFAPSAAKLDAELEAAWAMGREKGMAGMFVANPRPVNVELEVAFTLARTTNTVSKQAEGNKGTKTPRHVRPTITATSSPLSAERHALYRPAGVTWADVLREIDAVLHVAKMKLDRQSSVYEILERQREGMELVVAWEECLVWMKGVLFVDEGEMGTLRAPAAIPEMIEGKERV